MTDIQTIAHPVSKQMEECRRMFDSFMTHSNPLLNEVLQRVALRKGKMMRPLLTLLCAKLFGEIVEKTLLSALTFEFLHTASLIHDDVVDESDQRRGLTSVNFSYNNKIAVLVGDYILANCLQTAAMTDNPKLVTLVSKAAQDLADGELLQMRNVLNRDITQEIYFHIIASKTAALFSAAAESGAISGGASSEECEAAHSIGHNIGICFQLKDDVFDFVAGAEIGKPTGNDLREGKLTLPVLHALNSANDASMWNLARKVKEGKISSDEIEILVDFTIRNAGIDHTTQVMNDYAQKAKDILNKFPPSEVTHSLNAFIDYVVERNF